MKKSHLEMLREEVELARQGKIKYIPDPDFIVIDDPKKFQKRVNEIRKTNGLPPRKIDFGEKVHVDLELSKTAHDKAVKLAKKKKLPVTVFLSKIIEEAC